jgi:uncharacterized protein
MADVHVGALVAKPGQTARGHVPLINHPDGSPALLPMIIVNGKADGARLWVQACIHGNEYCGTEILLEAAARLSPETLRGAVIFVPALNVTAFQAGTRRSPLEGYGTGDLNRVFPGSADGTYTEQLAHRIHQLVKATATHLLDFHTGLHPETRWTLYADGLGTTSETAREMARAFGFRDVVGWQASFLQHSLFSVVGNDGVPGVIVEAGGVGNAFTPEMVREGVDGILNVLRSLKMLPGAPAYAPEYREMSSFAWLHGRTGGVFSPRVKPGDRVAKGQPIATMTSILGEAMDDITSPVDGIMLTIGYGTLMPVGGTVAEIGVEKTR